MRFRDFHQLPDRLTTGPLNLITDVPGLTVGHHTLEEDYPRFLRTGVTVIGVEDVVHRPVSAGCHVLNGYGKSMGLVQIEELGTMESPVFFTNTLSIGAVQQGAVELALLEDPARRSHNAVVMECNDGTLSYIRGLAVTAEMARSAYRQAGRQFAQGAVGAGTGMRSFGFRGGIGSASRVVEVEGRAYHVGAMVLSNFGNVEDLRIPGLNRSFAPVKPAEEAKGSLIMVVATDLPLLPHQLKRVARHMPLAIGLLGAPGYHGSGDLALAFSTGLRLGTGAAVQNPSIIANDGPIMSRIFAAATWSTAEAILDAMWHGTALKGWQGDAGCFRDAVMTDSTDITK